MQFCLIQSTIAMLQYLVIDYIMIEQVFNILLFIIFAIFFRGTETFYETEQNKIIRMENFQKKLFHHHCSVVVRKM